MQLRVQSPVRRPGRYPMIVLVCAFSMLASFDLCQMNAQSGPTTSSPQHKDVFRFEVRDGENDHPLPNASVTVVLWPHDKNWKQEPTRTES